MPQRKLISDKYRKARGGYSRLLEILCSNCGSHLCFYQKDGPGILKRLYLDRISGLDTGSSQLKCSKCTKQLGSKYNYEKENRPAYLLTPGTIAKKIVKL